MNVAQHTAPGRNPMNTHATICARPAPAATGAAAGKERAAKVLTLIRAGALAEKLHVTMQEIRATGDGEQLRAFTREIQRAIEGRC